MDVVYIISANNGDGSAFPRMQKSINSLRDGTMHFNLGIADCSGRSVYDSINQLDIGTYQYIHCPRTGPYNRSHNINVGVKRFVKDKHFWVSDIDILYEPDHLEECERRSQKYDYLTFSMNKVQYDGTIKLIEAGGGFFCKTRYFWRVRGFDEQYVGWGSEDCDFTDRVIYAGAVEKRGIKRPILTHMWHPTNKTDIELVEKNEARLIDVREQIKYGKFDNDTVNIDGWGVCDA